METVFVLVRTYPTLNLVDDDLHVYTRNSHDVIAIYESEENAKAFKEYIEKDNAKNVEQYGHLPEEYRIEEWYITRKDTVRYETYPDYDETDYDNVYRVFEVPRSWAIEWLKKYGETVESYQCEYTWDDSIQMYEQAHIDNVIVSERIERR